MKIVSSFLPPRALQKSITEKFNEHEFYFFKGMEQIDDKLIGEMEIFITYAEDLSPEIINRASSNGLAQWLQVLIRCRLKLSRAGESL